MELVGWFLTDRDEATCLYFGQKDLV